MADAHTEDQSLSDNSIEPEDEGSLKGVAGGLTIEMACPQCGATVQAHKVKDSWRFRCPACHYKQK